MEKSFEKYQQPHKEGEKSEEILSPEKLEPEEKFENLIYSIIEKTKEDPDLRDKIELVEPGIELYGEKIHYRIRTGVFEEHPVIKVEWGPFVKKSEDIITGKVMAEREFTKEFILCKDKKDLPSTLNVTTFKEKIEKDPSILVTSINEVRQKTFKAISEKLKENAKYFDGLSHLFLLEKKIRERVREKEEK